MNSKATASHEQISPTHNPSRICDKQTPSFDNTFATPLVRPKSSSRQYTTLWPTQRALGEDSCAEAFLLTITTSGLATKGFSSLLLTAHDENTMSLIQKSLSGCTHQAGEKNVGRESLFDCSKAVGLLGWHHKDVWVWEVVCKEPRIWRWVICTFTTDVRMFANILRNRVKLHEAASSRFQHDTKFHHQTSCHRNID